eukprot:806458-Heterocapsa_arctica.AAC.1
MKEQDLCQPCTENNKKVDIDGSATKVGASAYAGWGMWSPDNQNVKENGALKGRDQGSDRTEVRALVAALEKAIGGIEFITDNQYVRTQKTICLQVVLCTKENTAIYGKGSRTILIS